jgi:hypothetical protein
LKPQGTLWGPPFGTRMHFSEFEIRGFFEHAGEGGSQPSGYTHFITSKIS